MPFNDNPNLDHIVAIYREAADFPYANRVAQATEADFDMLNAQAQVNRNRDTSFVTESLGKALELRRKHQVPTFDFSRKLG